MAQLVSIAAKPPSQGRPSGHESRNYCSCCCNSNCVGSTPTTSLAAHSMNKPCCGVSWLRTGPGRKSTEYCSPEPEYEKRHEGRAGLTLDAGRTNENDRCEMPESEHIFLSSVFVELCFCPSRKQYPAIALTNQRYSAEISTLSPKPETQKRPTPSTPKPSA